MAQSKIRKGFFFYFGLFVLLLVAIFLVCLVIMMFNPGTTVLWMKYFTPKEELVVVNKLTDTGEAVAYGGLSGITVNCDYANVIVTANKDYRDTGIKIINKTRGFTAAKNAKDFGYTLTREGEELVLDVQEPTGFLFFSKQIDVLIYSNESTWAYGDHFKLTVKSEGSGNVEFGRSKENEGTIKLNAIDIETGSGNVSFLSTCDVSQMTGGVKISTNSGKIGAMSTNFGVGRDVELSTVKGKINFDTVNIGSNNLKITNTKGMVAINNIYAGKTDVSCERGNFVFKKVNGDLEFVAIDAIISPNIVVDEVVGGFNFEATNKKADSEINIGKISGALFVAAQKGKLNVKEANGQVYVISTDSLSENVVIGAANQNNIHLENQKGLLKIGFKGVVSSNVTLTNKSAKIEVNFTKVANFNTLAKKTSGEDVADSDISISIGDNSVTYNADKKCKLSVSGTSGVTGEIDLTTDSKIAYTLLETVA